MIAYGQRRSFRTFIIAMCDRMCFIIFILLVKYNQLYNFFSQCGRMSSVARRWSPVAITRTHNGANKLKTKANFCNCAHNESTATQPTSNRQLPVTNKQPGSLEMSFVLYVLLNDGKMSLSIGVRRCCYLRHRDLRTIAAPLHLTRNIFHHPRHSFPLGCDFSSN